MNNPKSEPFIINTVNVKKGTDPLNLKRTVKPEP